MKKGMISKKMDSFELLASDNPDLLLIALLRASIKILRLNAKEHLKRRDANKNRADVAQRNGEADSYDYFFNEYLIEDHYYRTILDELHQFGLTDKGCEELQKATKR